MKDAETLNNQSVELQAKLKIEIGKFENPSAHVLST